MLNLLCEFLLVVVFFIAFKLYDIYIATLVAIVCTFVQVIISRIYLKKFDNKQLVVLAILVLFGGMTLYFHNPIFIKWKPTIVFWLLGIAFLMNHMVGKKSFVERMMQPALTADQQSVPSIIWKRLHLAWTGFFLLLGCLNLLVAYVFSTNVWVYFKVYGILGTLILFALLQSMYLAFYFNRGGSPDDSNHSHS